MLLASAVLGADAATEPGGEAVVVVALPDNPTHAMREALNRLRGEAMAVGFEVRLVDATTEARSLTELDGVLAALRPAAVVAISRPADATSPADALDVWFLDRASGKASLAHLDAGDVRDTPERAEVVVAVRAVDFIRARMFDTLASRRVVVTARPPPAADVVRRYDLAIGVALLGVGSGFAPALAPQIATAFRPTPWLRLGLTAFGLGSKPQQTTDVGTVNVDARFVGVWVGLLGPTWHRLRPAIEVGGGEHWLVARGDGKPPNVGLSRTLSSPALSAAAGLGIELAPYLTLELRGGTLWLQSQVEVCAPEGTCLGHVGGPLWWDSLLLGARL